VSTAVDPDDIAWIDAKSKQPLCDVPWLGTSVVLSNGNVNFCCFSDAIVGNVNEQTFEQIWNGARMRDVRRALSEQRLPTECQSMSCPIFRGDTDHYLIDRMNGKDPARDRIEPSLVKERLCGSALSLSTDTVGAGETLGIAINLRWRGAPLSADLFIALRRDDGLCLFLPDYDDYAVPFATVVELSEAGGPLRIEAQADTKFIRGPCAFKVCAALFRTGSTPHLVSNCYWSQTNVVRAK
jgi:iron-sulfur cluster protein